MNAKQVSTGGRYEIHEQEIDGKSIYHWIIRTDDGEVYSHSAYHTVKSECILEAEDRLETARQNGTI